MSGGDLRSVDDCDAWVRRVYGDSFVPRDALCVSHVTALWRDPSEPSAPYTTLRINGETPRSRNDRIALGFARARAEVIVTTGRILRDEASLTHRYLEDDAGHRAFGEWRRERLGHAGPPWVLVLTSGRDLVLDHPVFHQGSPVVVYTGRDAAARLSRRSLPESLEIEGSDAPSLRAALHYLREARGRRAVSIEAGATTTRALYDPPLAVEELLLSLYQGDSLPASVHGPVFAANALWDGVLEHCSETRIDETSGPWSFARYRVRES